MTGVTGVATLALLAGMLGSAALLVLGMSFVFAQLVGWRSLVRSYGAARGGGTLYKASGVVLGSQSLSGPPLSVELDERGITLVATPVFRLAFKSFLIPWQRVESFEKRSYLFFDVVELRFGPEATSLLGFVPSKATAAIASQLIARGSAHLVR